MISEFNQLTEKYPSVRLLFSEGRAVTTLDTLIVPKELRKAGLGSEIMTNVINVADKNNVLLMLSVTKAFGATSEKRLTSFYKRFGFVENRGKRKRFELPRHDMYREPGIKSL